VILMKLGLIKLNPRDLHGNRAKLNDMRYWNELEYTKPGPIKDYIMEHRLI